MIEINLFLNHPVIDVVIYFRWLIEIMGAEDTLFASETFILEFKFNNK